MIGVQVALFAVLLLPVGLLVVVVRRFKQSVARDRAEVAAFARAHGFQGSFDTAFSLSGTFEGFPAYVSTDDVNEGRGRAAYRRFRLLTTGAPTHRSTGDALPSALVVARDASVPFERVRGLSELPSGDGAFDAAYRGFAAPGSVSPWSDPAMQSAILSLARYLVRAERGHDECSVTFNGRDPHFAVLERALQIAASLSSPESARRHAPELAAPLDTSPRPESERLTWGVARLLVVVLAGFIIGTFLGAFVPDPVGSVVAYVACEPGAKLHSGRNVLCVGKHGAEGVGGWALLTGVDIGWAAAFVVFSGVEIAARRSGGVRARRG